MRTQEIGQESGNRVHANLEALLRQKRDELRNRLNHRMGDVFTDREPDDEGAMATSNFATALAIVTMERERRELDEIESALERIKTGGYGVCEACGSTIRRPRLQALPWARLCLACAEQSPRWH